MSSRLLLLILLMPTICLAQGADEKPVADEQTDTQHKDMLDRHLTVARSTCGTLGIDYHLSATDRSFDLALLDFLHDRMRRRKRVRRAGGPRVRSAV